TIRALDLAKFYHAAPVSASTRAELIERSSGLAQSAGRMIFGNDRLLQQEVLAPELAKKGVVWEPLERAVIEHADLFRKHFMAQELALGSKKFGALHQAFVKSGTFLHVPRGVEIELPLEVFHWLHG